MWHLSASKKRMCKPHHWKKNLLYSISLIATPENQPTDFFSPTKSRWKLQSRGRSKVFRFVLPSGKKMRTPSQCGLAGGCTHLPGPEGITTQARRRHRCLVDTRSGRPGKRNPDGARARATGDPEATEWYERPVSPPSFFCLKWSTYVPFPSSQAPLFLCA